MAKYLVETYTPRREQTELAAIVDRVHRATAAMRRDGIEVRYLRPIFVPVDEMCFHLFEGPSPEAVGEASKRAELVYERIVEAVQ
jgi:hypothetical protein